MLNTVSRGLRTILRPMSRLYQTRIIFNHSQITKQLGFTEGFQNIGDICRMYVFDKYSEGCEGFTYKFRFDNQLKDTDFVYKLKFNQSPDPKIVFATNGEEMKLLKGATLDYAEEMMREIFYVKENPNAQISCSCKTSFSPKDYVF